MLNDKIRRLEQSVKEIKKDAELTPERERLIKSMHNVNSTEEAKRIWEEIYHCDPQLYSQMFRNAVRQLAERGRKEIDERIKAKI